jgi:hypothetical protein
MSRIRNHRRFIIASVCSLLAAAVGATLTAWVTGGLEITSGAPVLIPALLAGLVMLAFRPEVRRAHVGVLVLCGLIAAGTYAWTDPAGGWQAEDLPDERLDAMTLESVALRTCFDRQVMGVEGYEDVPEEIRAEARREVAEMSRRQREALVNERFGEVMNTEPADETRGASMAAWALAAGALAATPLMILTLLRRSE